MRLIKAFDPSLTTTGTLDTLGANNDEQLMLYNDSLEGLQLEFNDGSIGVIPPSWNKDFIIKSVPMGKVKWTVYNTLIATNNPISQVYGELYESGEHVASVNAPMQRGVTLTGGVVGTSIQAIDNEANAIGTAFIKSVVAGQTNPSIVFTNDMIGTISVLISAVLTQVLKINNVDPLVTLGAATHTVENLGNEKIDGTLTVPTISLNPVPVSVAGGTAGTANLYQLTVGTVKIVFVSLVGFQTGASNQNLVLPTAFTKGLQLWAGDTSNFSLLKTAVAQSINLYTSFAGTGGSSTPVTVVHIVSQGDCPFAIDTVQFISGGVSAHSGYILMIGV